MSQIKNLLILMLCFVFSFSTSSFASDEFDGEEVSSLLNLRDEDRFLVYGEYAEVEISARQSVELTLDRDIRPYGMELERLDDKTYVLFGRSEFIGKLCFQVKANKTNGRSSSERICLYSDENDEIQYPKFKNQRFFDSVQEGSHINISFDIEDYDVSVFQSLVTPLNGALSLNRNRRGVINLTGSITRAGLMEFIVRTI